MEQRVIWGLSPIQECWDKTGKAPVSGRWLDTNRGGDTAEAWEIRCRWVARHFKDKNDKNRFDAFASMPPLEAKK